jgi:hypothetical protein
VARVAAGAVAAVILLLLRRRNKAKKPDFMNYSAPIAGRGRARRSALLPASRRQRRENEERQAQRASHVSRWYRRRRGEGQLVVEHVVEREHDIVGRHRLAVAPGDALVSIVPINIHQADSQSSLGCLDFQRDDRWASRVLLCNNGIWLPLPIWN